MQLVSSLCLMQVHDAFTSHDLFFVHKQIFAISIFIKMCRRGCCFFVGFDLIRCGNTTFNLQPLLIPEYKAKASFGCFTN